MAIVITELASSTGSGAGDRKNIRRKTRTFRVAGVVPEAIPLTNSLPPIIDINGKQLPRPLDVHPTDPTIRCDTVDASPGGDGSSSLVTCTYSNDGSFLFAKRDDPTDQAYRKRIPGIVEVRYDIPIQIHCDKVVGTPPLTQTVQFWTIVDKEVIDYRQMIQVRVWVQDILSTELGILAAQSGVIHQIGSRKYLHKQPQVTAVEGGLEILYEWEFDKGTPVGWMRTTDPNVYTPEQAVAAGSGAIVPPPAPGLIRDPYHIYLVRPAPGGQDQAQYIQVRQYPENLNGWQTLPGNPGEMLQ